MPEKINKLPRRKFFGNLAKSAAGLLLASAFPIKFLDKKTAPSGKKIKIIAHPLAVKRKGLRG
ncbi:MAG TPA: hypothetical protein VHO43_00400 [Ignavibacteriales bacterium]|nr:hypothetical protein [Ignavibacteriales bacterium]